MAPSDPPGAAGPLDPHDTLPPEMDPAVGGGAIDAPTDFFGILGRLGPGLIIAGSIVGSGELIATTKTGAQAGIQLLWLIVVGCLIKVFVQVELGRFAITHGETTLAALDQVPGPRLRANWILWFWFFTMLASIGQLGGIVGGVGQSMAISFPLSGDYAAATGLPSTSEMGHYLAFDDVLLAPWDLERKANVRKWKVAEKDSGWTEPERDWVEAASKKLDYLAALHAAAGTKDVPDRALLESRAARAHAAATSLDAARKEGRDTATRMLELQVEADAAAAELEKTVTAFNRATIGVDPFLFDKVAATLPKAEQPDSRRGTVHAALYKAARNEVEQKTEGAPSRREKSAKEPKDLARDAAASVTTPEDVDRLLRGQMTLARQMAAADAQEGRATRALIAVRAQRNATEAKANLAQDAPAEERSRIDAEFAGAKSRVAALVEPRTWDDKAWAVVVAVVTSVLLYVGRYGFIQHASTVMVVAFTFVTMGNVVALQTTEQWHITLQQFLDGFKFRLPEAKGGIDPLKTALATFGIIGVGATELIAYPYWCLEKGYAKFAGRRTDDAAWAARAKGWLRVMRWDAFLSMVIYTTATLAFFLLGVAVLYREGRDPDGMRMVTTLSSAYVPVFGEYARWMFLLGAFAVLYSTFLVANAGSARMFTDGLKVFGLIDRHDPKVHDRSIGTLSILLPLLCLAIFCSGANPVTLVLLAGAMQATMLPMIGFGALYFRYRMTDPRIKPTPIWDACLLVSCVGLLVAGVWGGVSHFAK